MARSNLAGVTSRRPFTILGIVLALLVIAAFVLVAINASTGNNVAQESVVVATRDLSPRIPIDPGSLELKSIPVGGFPSTILFQKVDEVKGMIPLVTIVQGQPITSNLIAKPGTTLGSQSEYLPIPSGFVALTLPTSEQQGVAGYIQPDDYIKVIATVDQQAKIATATVFASLHVIRVGLAGSDAAGTNNATPAIATSLTVVVTECQAELLTWFLTYASLKYTLLSYHDYSPTANDSGNPNCANLNGVNQKAVQAFYPQLF